MALTHILGARRISSPMPNHPARSYFPFAAPVAPPRRRRAVSSAAAAAPAEPAAATTDAPPSPGLPFGITAEELEAKLNTVRTPPFHGEEQGACRVSCSASCGA